MIVAKQGLSRLTLDAVSKKAGLSKGALLHHFRSKAELARHMLHESIAQCDERLRAHRAGDTLPGAWTRAYLLATLDERFMDNGHRIALLLVTHGRDPHLSKILLDTISRWSRLIENDGLDPIKAQIVRLAADGLWWSETAGVAIFPKKQQRRDFILKLIELTKA
jgi:AcrR family transcriptional regulator